MIGRRRRWMYGTTAVLCLAAVAVGASLIPAWQAPPSSMLELDLSGAHPQIAETIRAAQEQVRRRPGLGLAWGRLGTVLMAHDLDTAAIDCLRQAIKLDPKQFRWPYFAATLEERSDLDGALAHYEMAVALQPDHAPLRCRLATLLQRLGRLDDAERHYREAARLAPDNQHPWLGLGRIAISRGDRTTALTCFKNAVSRAAWDRTAQSELARIAFLTGDLATAARCREQIAQLPESAPLMADQTIQEISNLKSDVLRLPLTADSLAAHGDLANAAEAYRVLSREYPDRPRPRISLGITLQRMGEIAAAAEVFREAARDFPADPLAHYQLALALGLLQIPDGAIRSYQDCLALKPDFAPALLGLGLLLKKRGDLEGAKAALRNAVEADPQFVSAYLPLATLELEQGHRDEAIRHLESAVHLAPDDQLAQACLRRAKEQSDGNQTEHSQQ